MVAGLASPDTCVISAVTEGIHTWGLMLCGCHLEILKRFFLSICIWYVKKEGTMEYTCTRDRSLGSCAVSSLTISPKPQDGFLTACLLLPLGSSGPTLSPPSHTCPLTPLALFPVTSVSRRPGFCYCPLLLAGAWEQTWGRPRCCHLGSCSILGHPKEASVPPGMAEPWRVL